MDEKEKAPAPEPQAQAPAKAAVKAPESVYSAEALAKNYKALGASRALVATALKLAKKETATLAEAQKIVNAFKNKEVK